MLEYLLLFLFCWCYNHEGVFMQKIRQYNNQLNSILEKIEDAFCKLGRKIL